MTKRKNTFSCEEYRYAYHLFILDCYYNHYFPCLKTDIIEIYSRHQSDKLMTRSRTILFPCSDYLNLFFFIYLTVTNHYVHCLKTDVYSRYHSDKMLKRSKISCFIYLLDYYQLLLTLIMHIYLVSSTYFSD